MHGEPADLWLGSVYEQVAYMDDVLLFSRWALWLKIQSFDLKNEELRMDAWVEINNSNKVGGRRISSSRITYDHEASSSISFVSELF